MQISHIYLKNIVSPTLGKNKNQSPIGKLGKNFLRRPVIDTEPNHERWFRDSWTHSGDHSIGTIYYIRFFDFFTNPTNDFSASYEMRENKDSTHQAAEQDSAQETR